MTDGCMYPPVENFAKTGVDVDDTFMAVRYLDYYHAIVIDDGLLFAYQ